jgi:hypothetical protein
MENRPPNKSRLGLCPRLQPNSRPHTPAFAGHRGRLQVAHVDISLLRQVNKQDKLNLSLFYRKLAAQSNTWRASLATPLSPRRVLGLNRCLSRRLRGNDAAKLAPPDVFPYNISSTPEAERKRIQATREELERNDSSSTRRFLKIQLLREAASKETNAPLPAFPPGSPPAGVCGAASQSTPAPPSAWSTATPPPGSTPTRR